MEWAYGVTTVPARVSGVLRETLTSLATAGFREPHIFVDGHTDAAYGYAVTSRDLKLGAYGNWVTGLWELYVKHPMAERYLLFQDDIVAPKNLRQYLERCKYPERGYWNLYTVPANDLPGVSGWVPSPRQDGKGALGLCFDRDALVALLSSVHMVQRVQDLARGHKSIDGAVVTAMSNAGWQEFIHQPSLLQHRAGESAIGNSTKAPSVSFPGEGFDALQLCASNSETL